jgi:hypothetical protein
MSHLFVVLDVRGLALELGRISKAFVEHHNHYPLEIEGISANRMASYMKYTPLVTMNEAQATQYVKILVQDTVESSVAYKKPSNKIRALASLMFGLPLEAVDYVHEIYAREFDECDAVVQVFMELISQVGDHIGDNVWVEWDVHANYNMIALIRGRDFRITEYERLTNTRPDRYHLVEIDLSNMASYIKQSLIDSMGPRAGFVNLAPILQDAFMRQYPRMAFDNDLPGLLKDATYDFGGEQSINYELLAQLGITNYEEFYNHFIVQVFDFMNVTRLCTRLDKRTDYTASLGKDWVITIDESLDRKTKRQLSEVEEMAMSLLAGDRLPENERRLAEAYIMENGGEALSRKGS